MTDIPYRGIFAYDPTSGQLVTGGSGQVYATTDTTFSTPLAVKSLSGVTMSSIGTTDIGMLDEFTVADQTTVNWKSGNYVVLLWSPAGMQAAVDAANAAVQSALASVQSLQTQVLALIQQGGSGGGLPAGTTLDAIPNGSSRFAVSSAQMDRINQASTLQLGTAANTAMPGNTTFTAVQVGAVPNPGATISGAVYRTAAQGLPAAVVNAQLVFVANS